jgi:hypothetical protein
MIKNEKPSFELLEDLHKQLNERSKIYEKEQSRKKMALNLNICSECGSDLIQERVEKFEKPNTYLFGLISIQTKMWKYRKVCSNNVKHYEDKY